MLTNSRNAFRGQSRSPNMVPFDMLGMVLLVCYSNFVPKTRHFFQIFDFKNVVTLKSGSEVIESGTIR